MQCLPAGSGTRVLTDGDEKMRTRIDCDIAVRALQGFSPMQIPSLRNMLVAAALAMSLLGISRPAFANTITYTFGGPGTSWNNNSPYPNSNQPYLKAMFNDTTAANYVLLTLTPSFLSPTDDIKLLGFNINPFVPDVKVISSTSLTTGTSLTSAVTSSLATNGENLPGAKEFDIKFNLGPGGNSVLSGTQPITVLLNGTGLTANSFNARDPLSPFYYAYAQVQTANGSFEGGTNGPPAVSAVPPIPVSVPLPRTIFAGAGLFSIIALRRLIGTGRRSAC
jgi:hypothetical protein